MLFYYGTKATNLKNGQITNVDCPNCETNVSMIYSVYGKYAHLYLIPFFPVKKLTFTECYSCKKTFEQADLSSSIQQKLEREKEKNGIKTPIWMFSGLFIIAIIAVMGFYSSHQTDVDTENFIKNPKAGDVYYLNSTDGFFTTMKINGISKDSLNVSLNNMEIDKKTEMYKIDVDSNYTNKSSIAKKDALKLYTDKEIFEVRRQ
ncbi:MAG: zinc-ribbon domain-containing protein [Flavobacterium sp.]|nr:MAG: zinc-ribbon domain-containing protein [Flavobacterium sp.]